MAVGKTLWHIFKEIIVYIHVGAAVLSGAGWATATLSGLDPSWRRGLAFGFGYCLLVLFMTMAFWLWAAWKRDYQQRWRQWREYRRYTSRGLNWKVFGHGSDMGRAQAILRITSTSELPQPLDIVVECAGGIEHFYPNFYADPTKPTERDTDADIEMWSPGSRPIISFTLRSPKLHAPSYLDIALRSAGNANIKVLTVRRSPDL